MAILVGIIIIAISLVWGGITLMALGMSDNPGQTVSFTPTIMGLVLGAIVIASHWMPHIGW